MAARQRYTFSSGFSLLPWSVKSGTHNCILFFKVGFFFFVNNFLSFSLSQERGTEVLLWSTELPGLPGWRESRQCTGGCGEEAKGAVSEERSCQCTDYSKWVWL